MSQDWRPTADLATLHLRAALLNRARAFFAARVLLEVDTPLVINAPASDVHIESAQVLFTGSAQPRFLHTSPEYAMKRLLAAGSGDIFQICHVVRGLERGRHHNSEFTLVEWYRLNFSLDALMDEVAALLSQLLPAGMHSLRVQKRSYRDVFREEIQVDPLTADLPTLREAARRAGYESDTLPADSAEPAELRDELLQMLMGSLIGPRLGADTLCFVHGYPASQAALARLDPDDPRTALRFELYYRGVELANGFHELASAAEQRQRFQLDTEMRRARGMPAYAPDERMLAALSAGLPECAGVALGFDRVVMLAAGAATISEVLAFPTERA